MFSALLNLAKELIAKSPARLVGYGSSLAVAGALKLAEQFGVTIPADVLAGISLATGFLISELIRKFVYSPNTTQNIAIRAAVTGNTDIGSPPKG